MLWYAESRTDVCTFVKMIGMNRQLLVHLLREEAEDDETLLHLLTPRGKVHQIFTTRNDYGCYTKLVVNHLRQDDKKFAEFLRLSTNQFDFVLSLIQDDIKKFSYNRQQYPITPEEKLALTLR